MLRSYILLLTMAPVACGGLREERWDDEVARVSCRTLRRCDPITFWRDYASVSSCVDATDPGDYTFCAYDAKAAKQCVSAMKWSCRKIGRRYDEVVERCDAAWTCAAPQTTDSDTGT